MGVRSARPWDMGGPVSKKIFLALWASVWSKNGGGGGGWLPGPLPWIRLCGCVCIVNSVNYWDQLYWLQINFVLTQSYCLRFCLTKQWGVVVVISLVEHKVLVVTIVGFQLLHSFSHKGNKLNILYRLPIHLIILPKRRDNRELYL